MRFKILIGPLGHLPGLIEEHLQGMVAVLLIPVLPSLVSF